MSRLLSVIAGAAIAALFAFGCGDSDSGTTEVSNREPVISRAQFIKQAEAACAEVTKKREVAAAAWQEEHPGNSAEALDSAFREVVAPAIEEQVEALEALPAPAGSEAKIDQMVGNLAKAGQKISREGTGGTGAPELFEFQKQADNYGLETCAGIF